jgi:hypothetical protein
LRRLEIRYRIASCWMWWGRSCGNAARAAACAQAAWWVILAAEEEIRMSIRARVEDAILLWKSGRKEGAFLNALVGVAAASRRRFPDRKSVGDREAFVQFLEAARSGHISVEYRGECLPIEQVFYKWIRCQLVHEGELPEDIEFMPDAVPGTYSLRAGGSPEYILKVSEWWFHYLITAIISAPENAAEFQGFHV